MIVGSLTGLLVWLVIASIVWVFNFLQKAVTEAQAKSHEERPVASQRSGRETMRGQGGQQAEGAEDERTRKFLEALGLPPGEPVARPAAATILRPVTQRSRLGGDIMPVPPFVAPTSLGRTGERARRLQPPPPELPRGGNWTAGLPTPPPLHRDHTSLADFHFPEMRIPEVAEFHTRSSEVSAIPATVRREIPVAKSNRGVASEHELIRLFRSSEGLRSAIIMSEILGPPRGLQSYGISSRVKLL